MFRMPLEAFTSDESFPFFIQFGGHNEPLFLHGHDDYSELVIVLSGTAQHIVGSERYTIGKGDVFVIDTDTEHGYDAPSDFRICNIMFRRSFVDLSKTDIAQSAGFQALFILEPRNTQRSGFTSRLHLDGENFLRIERFITRIHDEYYGDLPGKKTLIEAYFLDLVVILSRLYDTHEIRENDGIVKLASAIAYIEKHYFEEISIAELSKLSNYSQRHFIRLFKEALGCVPMQYITRLRIEKACDMLSNTSLSITEVAFRCGYPDSNYFSKLFRKYIGCSPRSYRDDLTVRR